MISVVIPTVKGREYSLDRTVKAYQDTYDDLEIIGIPNTGKPCGYAWAKGAEESQGEYIHFSADDLVPRPGWAEAAIEANERGVMPAATVYNDGVFLDCPVYMLPRYDNVPNVLVPFLTREQWEMGGWVVPIHYGTDDWITYLAMLRDIPVERIDAFAFDHYAAPEERQESRPRDVPALCTYMQDNGYVPLVYGQLAASFGWAGWIG